MKYIKKFVRFVESAPATKPAPSPSTAPTTEPATKPVRRDRPSPIRRDRPAIEPDPQALKKAKVEDVVENFLEIAREEKFDFKKYFPNI